MEYEILITKREPNPEYTQKRSPYETEVNPYISINQLTVVITEEQFQAIRKAVLEKF